MGDFELINLVDYNEVLHASQDPLQSLMQIENESHEKLEPQTLKDLLVGILHANPDTKYISKRIKRYEEAELTEHAKQIEYSKNLRKFLRKVRRPLLDSIQASTSDKWTLPAVEVLFYERIPTLKAFYEKVQNIFIKDADLQNSVKEFLKTRDPGNKVIIFLIFLIRSFLDSPDTIEENEETKYYLGLSAQDQGAINLKEGQQYNFKVFTVFNTTKPTNPGEYFEIAIPKRTAVPGRFYSLIDPYYKDDLLLPAYTGFIIKKIEEDEKGVKVIQLRFASEDDLNNMKDNLIKKYLIPQPELRVLDDDNDDNQFNNVVSEVFVDNAGDFVEHAEVFADLAEIFVEHAQVFADQVDVLVDVVEDFEENAEVFVDHAEIFANYEQFEEFILVNSRGQEERSQALDPLVDLEGNPPPFGGYQGWFRFGDDQNKILLLLFFIFLFL